MKPRTQILGALAVGTVLGLAAGLPHVQARPAPADAVLAVKVARLEGQVDFLAAHVAALETRLRPQDGHPRPLSVQPPSVIPGPQAMPGGAARPTRRPPAP